MYIIYNLIHIMKPWKRTCVCYEMRCSLASSSLVPLVVYAEPRTKRIVLSYIPRKSQTVFLAGRFFECARDVWAAITTTWFANSRWPSIPRCFLLFYRLYFSAPDTYSEDVSVCVRLWRFSHRFLFSATLLCVYLNEQLLSLSVYSLSVWARNT